MIAMKGTCLLLLCWCLLIFKTRAECNGGPTLCNRPYSEIVHLITHDSYALSPNIAATQDFSIINQLDDGVRGIKLSAVPSLLNPETVHLCHTICTVLDAGRVVDTLNDISNWLSQNPKEVVTIMWNNLYDLKATQLAEAYTESTIMPYIFTHNQSDPWPTLQQMIDSGKRLVNFVDSQADSEHVPWLMDQFSRVFETPYDNTDLDAFNCKVDRIAQEHNPKDLIYVMNHFLYGLIEIGSLKVEIPLRDLATAANSIDSIASHIQNCTNILGKIPSFIEVDFYTLGDALSVVADLNGVPVNKSYLARKATIPVDNTTSSVHKTGFLSPTEHVIIDNLLYVFDISSANRLYLDLVSFLVLACMSLFILM